MIHLSIGLRFWFQRRRCSGQWRSKEYKSSVTARGCCVITVTIMLADGAFANRQDSVQWLKPVNWHYIYAYPSDVLLHGPRR